MVDVPRCRAGNPDGSEFCVGHECARRPVVPKLPASLAVQMRGRIPPARNQQQIAGDASTWPEHTATHGRDVRRRQSTVAAGAGDNGSGANRDVAPSTFA